MGNNKIYAIRQYRTLEEELENDYDYGHVVYVGKTNRELYQRLEQHKNDHTHPEKVHWLSKNKHEIVLLEDDLEAWEVPDREQHWIERFGCQFKLNRIRARKHTYSDGVAAEKRAKERIKQMKKANK